MEITVANQELTSRHQVEITVANQELTSRHQVKLTRNKAQIIMDGCGKDLCIGSVCGSVCQKTFIQPLIIYQDNLHNDRTTGQQSVGLSVTATG